MPPFYLLHKKHINITNKLIHYSISIVISHNKNK